MVVDDGSSDETPELLAELRRTASIPVTVVPGTRCGVAAARNLAAEHARGTWLASFDDDQLALPGWLAALRELAGQTGSPCIGGALELSLPSGQRIEDLGPRVRRVLGEHLDGDIARPNGLLPASNNVLVRRDVFLHLGGYDVRFTEGAEDSELFDRIAAAGHTIWFQPAARALHITPQSRLQSNNLRWTSLRIGASEARRFAHQGAGKLLKLIAIRLAASLLRDVPQLLWALVSRNKRLLLDVHCSLWYSQGLLRAAPTFLGIQRGESSFLRSLDFRTRNGERGDATLRAKPIAD